MIYMFYFSKLILITLNMLIILSTLIILVKLDKVISVP